VLAVLGCRVFSVERIDALATRARERFDELGLDSIEVHVGDGSLGLSAAAPFDRIIVTAAGPSVPDSLYEQLTPGGILVMPVGGRFCQSLLRIRRRDGGPDEERLLSCVFVPLVGAEAWKESP
jgi:protein-L-isoaspartate(D-aspartate) O-methyltransferase